jgi:hypothetical protein
MANAQDASGCRQAASARDRKKEAHIIPLPGASRSVHLWTVYVNNQSLKTGLNGSMSSSRCLGRKSGTGDCLRPCDGLSIAEQGTALLVQAQGVAAKEQFGENSKMAGLYHRFSIHRRYADGRKSPASFFPASALGVANRESR